MTPEDETITVEVTVKAPENKNKEFTGDLKIQVIGNPDDEIIIPVTLTTPKSKLYINSPLLQFLENHPHIFPLIRQIPGL